MKFLAVTFGPQSAPGRKRVVITIKYAHGVRQSKTTDRGELASNYTSQLFCDFLESSRNPSVAQVPTASQLTITTSADYYPDAIRHRCSAQVFIPIKITPNLSGLGSVPANKSSRVNLVLTVAPGKTSHLRARAYWMSPAGPWTTGSRT